jgi:hypothetical protein
MRRGPWGSRSDRRPEWRARVQTRRGLWGLRNSRSSEDERLRDLRVGRMVTRVRESELGWPLQCRSRSSVAAAEHLFFWR